jgi:anti-sigma regulatory factor (Ser/Thr protein kinase)
MPSYKLIQLKYGIILAVLGLFTARSIQLWENVVDIVERRKSADAALIASMSAQLAGRPQPASIEKQVDAIAVASGAADRNTRVLLSLQVGTYSASNGAAVADEVVSAQITRSALEYWAKANDPALYGVGRSWKDGYNTWHMVVRKFELGSKNTPAYVVLITNLNSAVLQPWQEGVRGLAKIWILISILLIASAMIVVTSTDKVVGAIDAPQKAVPCWWWPLELRVLAERFNKFSESGRIAQEKLVASGEEIERMYRCLANIINNAIKYCDKGTEEVEIGMIEKPDCIILYVRDNGIGIAPENIYRVLNSYGVQARARAAFEESGLGIYGAQQIAKQHGFLIGCKSSLGNGSIFFISIPSEKCLKV